MHVRTVLWILLKWHKQTIFTYSEKPLKHVHFHPSPQLLSVESPPSFWADVADISFLLFVYVHNLTTNSQVEILPTKFENVNKVTWGKLCAVYVFLRLYQYRVKVGRWPGADLSILREGFKDQRFVWNGCKDIMCGSLSWRSWFCRVCLRRVCVWDRRGGGSQNELVSFLI